MIIVKRFAVCGGCKRFTIQGLDVALAAIKADTLVFSTLGLIWNRQCLFVCLSVNRITRKIAWITIRPTGSTTLNFRVDPIENGR